MLPGKDIIEPIASSGGTLGVLKVAARQAAELRLRRSVKHEKKKMQSLLLEHVDEADVSAQKVFEEAISQKVVASVGARPSRLQAHADPQPAPEHPSPAVTAVTAGFTTSELYAREASEDSNGSPASSPGPASFVTSLSSRDLDSEGQIQWGVVDRIARKRCRANPDTPGTGIADLTGHAPFVTPLRLGDGCTPHRAAIDIVIEFNTARRHGSGMWDAFNPTPAGGDSFGGAQMGPAPEIHRHSLDFHASDSLRGSADEGTLSQSSDGDALDGESDGTALVHAQQWMASDYERTQPPQTSGAARTKAPSRAPRLLHRVLDILDKRQSGPRETVVMVELMMASLAPPYSLHSLLKMR